MRRAFVLLAAIGFRAFAQAPPPDELRTLLLPLRAHADDHEETRGATPVLTRIKHLLRDWIETRLSSLEPWDEGGALSHQLDADLEHAGLAMVESPDPSGVEPTGQTLVGFLGDVKVRRSGDVLVVQTGVGIECGFDESAYAYELAANRWRRFWESEQNDYTKAKYHPQSLHEVLVSPTNYEPEADKTEHLVLTLGAEPWCSSNWHDVYYRVWQTKAAYSQPKLLLDGSEWAYVSEPIQGSVWPKDVLIEYAIGSVDVECGSRRQIRHYVLTSDKLERVDPVVLGPRDFVDNWLTGPWAEASQRTAAASLAALENWHRKLKGPFEFTAPTCHCTGRPDLWQVGVDDPDGKRPPVFFLIRWRPPYHFTMVDIGGKGWPDCTEEDREADAFRTLFPSADWHAD
jgi:hypothetical protein